MMNTRPDEISGAEARPLQGQDGPPGIELRANLNSISHRCHLFEVAFVWELTEETFHLPHGLPPGRQGGD